MRAVALSQLALLKDHITPDTAAASAAVSPPAAAIAATATIAAAAAGTTAADAAASDGIALLNCPVTVGDVAATAAAGDDDDGTAVVDEHACSVLAVLAAPMTRSFSRQISTCFCPGNTIKAESELHHLLVGCCGVIPTKVTVEALYSSKHGR